MMNCETSDDTQQLADRLTVIGAAPDETLVEGDIADILTGTRKSTRYRLIRQGRFPAPIKVTAYASRWRLGDLRAWLSDPAGWRATREAA